MNVAQRALLAGSILIWIQAMPARSQSSEPVRPDPARDAAQWAQTESQSASALLSSGDAKQAIEKLRAVVEGQIARSGADSPLVAQALSNLAYVLAADGQLPEARATAERALDLAHKVGMGAAETALIQRNLAEIAEKKGDLSEAQVWIEDAWRALEAQIGKKPVVAETREAAARIALALGQVDVAQAHLEWSLAIHEKLLGPIDAATARPIAPLATLLASRGNFDAALKLYHHARAILETAEQGGSQPWFESFESELALLARLGERRGAMAMVDQLRRAAPSDASVEAREMDLSVAARLLDLGDGPRARETLERALASVDEQGENVAFERLRRLAPLSQARALCGDHAGAVETADAALALVHETGIEESEIEAELALRRGQSLLELGRAGDAMVDLRRALDLFRGALGKNHPRLLPALFALVRCENALKGVSIGQLDLLDMCEAPLAHCTPAGLAQREFAGWWSGSARFDGALVSGLYRAAQANGKKFGLASAFQALDRSRERSLATALAWCVESSASSSETALGRYLGALRGLESSAAAESERTAAEAQLTELRAKLAEKSSPLAKLVLARGATLDEARSLLTADDQVLVLFSWTDDDVWAMVVAHDAARDRIVRLGAAKEIAPELTRMQAALRKLDAPCDLTRAAELLFQPLAESLASASRAIVIADGPLAYVPFEALPLEGRPWIERCRVRNATSVEALLALRDAPKVAAGDRCVHVGPAQLAEEVPVSHQLERLRARFDAQPGAGPAPALDEVLPANVASLSGDAARESSLKQKSAGGELDGLRLLELEVPTYVDAEVPSACGFVLSAESTDDGLPGWRRENGMLDLGELFALRLGARRALLPLAEVGPDAAATLHSEGLHALVLGLWSAGAREVVISSWTTPDNCARRFDAQLTQRLRSQDAADAADALGDAQRAWIASAKGDAKLAHPGVWARLRCFGL